jgi:hypothetical protein
VRKKTISDFSAGIKCLLHPVGISFFLKTKAQFLLDKSEQNTIYWAMAGPLRQTFFDKKAVSVQQSAFSQIERGNLGGKRASTRQS